MQPSYARSCFQYKNVLRVTKYNIIQHEWYKNQHCVDKMYANSATMKLIVALSIEIKLLHTQVCTISTSMYVHLKKAIQIMSDSTNHPMTHPKTDNLFCHVFSRKVTKGEKVQLNTPVAKIIVKM